MQLTKQELKLTGYYWILFEPETHNLGSSQTGTVSNTEPENTKTFQNRREKLGQSCRYNLKDLRPREKVTWSK